MTTSNHVLAGTLIAVMIKEPLLALPLAFLSHFVLDALPHYGYGGGGYAEALKHKLTFVMESFGFIGLFFLVWTGLYGWNLVLLAAVLAVSPDFEWPYRYVFFERKGLEPPSTFLTKFHQSIQRYERSWGIIPEILLFIGGYTLLITKYL